MDYDGLFVNSKWEIIKRITNNPITPQELAKEMGTSLANISQQLRFLEFGGLIKKERIKSNGFGKPKNSIGIAKDFSYIVYVTKNKAKKELLELDYYKKILLGSWIFLESRHHRPFENFINDHRDRLDSISRIYYDGPSGKISVLFDTPVGEKRKYEGLDFIFLQDSAKQEKLGECIYKR